MYTYYKPVFSAPSAASAVEKNNNEATKAETTRPDNGDCRWNRISGKTSGGATTRCVLFCAKYESLPRSWDENMKICRAHNGIELWRWEMWIWIRIVRPRCCTSLPFWHFTFAWVTSWSSLRTSHSGKKNSLRYLTTSRKLVFLDIRRACEMYIFYWQWCQISQMSTAGDRWLFHDRHT